MTKYKNIDAVINNIRNNVQHKTFSDDITIPLQFSNQIDVRGTLELLNTTNDIKLQTKLFSVLTACLMLNNEANFEIIIKYSAVYDKIKNLLVKGLPRKAEHALNFLSALLYVDAQDDGPTKRRTLALYAKNMARVSGCLGTMTDMFTNSMMFHDTWNALCRCLAAACGGSELNQTYCTHLIPVCVQRCNQTNIEIFLVLQSLLQKHNRNIELFLNSNGISMFTRELLHYDKCLQLLITVVQCSATTSLLLRQVRILDDLQDFLRLYGPSSQIGQKAMIILKHVELRSRGSDSQINQTTEPTIIKSNCNNSQIYEYDEKDKSDDTATLMQKVMKEVFNYKQNQLASIKKEVSKVDVNSIIRSTSTMRISIGGQRNNREIHMRNPSNNTKTLMKEQQRDRVQGTNEAEQSFTFLNSLNKGLSRNTDHIKPIDRSKILHDKKPEANKKLIDTQTFANPENDFPYFSTTISNEKPTSIDPKDFRPIFSSTPRHGDDSKTTRKSRCSTQSLIALQRNKKVTKRKRKKMSQNNYKNIRNMSLSSRFFSAINESCTTLVQTVTNMFKKNDPSDFSKDRTETHSSRAENASCSFSFLNYMQKRDAVFNKLLKTGHKDTNFSLGTESCETCDSHALKKKMARNEHLKKTVKKLKMGINLYGCDFKKISRTMWPQESYMTPTVLYNLYRKLLLK